jgi:hypothetical protein
VQAEAIKKFRDLKAGKIREPGEVFTVSRERFHELEGKGFVKESGKQKEVSSMQQP